MKTCQLFSPEFIWHEEHEFNLIPRYGFAIRNWKPIINLVVTRGEYWIIFPCWWTWSILDSIKAFLFGEMCLIKNEYK